MMADYTGYEESDYERAGMRPIVDTPDEVNKDRVGYMKKAPEYAYEPLTKPQASYDSVYLYKLIQDLQQKVDMFINGVNDKIGELSSAVAHQYSHEQELKQRDALIEKLEVELKAAKAEKKKEQPYWPKPTTPNWPWPNTPWVEPQSPFTPTYPGVPYPNWPYKPYPEVWLDGNYQSQRGKLYKGDAESNGNSTY